MHSDTQFHVYMLGFLPGFPYMGDLPQQLALPRRPDPRLRVPAGSISIATSLTAIYPYESPGGWHLIGTTPIRLFDADRARPALLAPGDAVRFQPIDPASFASIRRRGRERQLRGRKHADCRMTAALKVLAPGLHTTVQDLGRVGYQDIGVPVSGALDSFSLRLANALVGNPPRGGGARDPVQRADLEDRRRQGAGGARRRRRRPPPRRRRAAARGGRAEHDAGAGRQSFKSSAAGNRPAAILPLRAASRCRSSSAALRLMHGRRLAGSTAVRCSRTTSCRWRSHAPPSVPRSGCRFHRPRPASSRSA